MVRHVLGPLRPQLPILPHVHSSPRGDHGRDEIQGRNNYDRISILSSIRTGRSNAARHARRTGPQRRGAEGLVGLYCPSSQDRCRDARSIARHCAPRRRSPRSGSIGLPRPERPHLPCRPDGACGEGSSPGVPRVVDDCEARTAPRRERRPCASRYLPQKTEALCGGAGTLGGRTSYDG